MNTNPRWVVPSEFEFQNLDPHRPLIAGRHLPDWPALHLWAMRALEARLEGGTTPLDLAAWQVSCGSDRRAVQTVEAILASTPTAEESLSCAHVLAVVARTEDGATSSYEIYRQLWQGESFRDHPRRLELAVSLAADMLAYKADKALALLESVRPLSGVTQIEAATFELLAAVAKIGIDSDGSAERIARAHDLFIAANDPIGMAQCALAEYQRERVRPASRHDTMLQCLNYAVHQYHVSCRFAWAAETLWFAVVPFLADQLGAGPDELAPVFSRAADYAERGRSFQAWETIRRSAHRFGLWAREKDDAWVFERQLP